MMILNTLYSHLKSLFFSYSEIFYEHLMIKLNTSFRQQVHSHNLHFSVLRRKFFLHQMMTAPFIALHLQ